MQDELPPPSAELILISVMVQAYLAGLGPKRRARFIKRAADLLEAYGDLNNIRRIRSRTADAELAKAVELAHGWFKTVAPTFMVAGE